MTLPLSHSTSAVFLITLVAKVIQNCNQVQNPSKNQSSERSWTFDSALNSVSQRKVLVMISAPPPRPGTIEARSLIFEKHLTRKKRESISTQSNCNRLTNYVFPNAETLLGYTTKNRWLWILKASLWKTSNHQSNLIYSSDHMFPNLCEQRQVDSWRSSSWSRTCCLI